MLSKFFEKRVADFINSRHLLSRDVVQLVALSGGADSVALLRVLLSLDYRVEAVHCNFLLRGEESYRDEQFVKDLCESLNVPLHLIHFDTKEYASLHQVSIEMAARQLRYRYFGQLRADIGAQRICVAHHRDDAVETLLMNLLRGSGIHGLTGIRERNGDVVRPLLCVSRQDILCYLEQAGLSYVTDSTNLEPDVLRNKIRLQVLPLLNSLTPAAAEAIDKTASYLAEAERVYNDAIRQQSEQVLRRGGGDAGADEIRLAELMKVPSPECLLHELLVPYGFPSAVSDQLARALPDVRVGSVFLSATHRMAVDRQRLLIEELTPEMRALVIPETGTYVLSDGRRLRVEIVQSPSVSRSADVASLDAAKVRFPLTFRPVVPGDRFVPYGMKKGSRLVSDYLTDRKRSVLAKLHQTVVADATGAVAWLVGERTDQRFCVDHQTVSTLLLSVVP